MARYREIVAILWDERLYDLFVPGTFQQLMGAAPTSAPSASDQDPVEVRVRRAVERLGPAFIKAAQLLATRHDLVSPALAAELAKLQDAVPPFPSDDAVARVEADLGAPIEELFASFDREPLAAASIGQVHRATLPDGRRMVVKVQRPGVTEQMDVDLDIIERQSRTAAHWSASARDLDIPAITRRFVEAVRSELDYRNEARNLERFRAGFASDPHVVIPEVDWDRTTARVLTMSELVGIPGTHADELDAAGVDRAALVQVGVEAYFRQIFVIGAFHADPHPGNLFAMPESRVGIVDFGRVATIGERDQDRALDLLSAIVEDDEVGATQVLLETCQAGSTVDRAAVQVEVADLLDSYLARGGDGIGLDGVVERLFGMVRAFDLRMPDELAVLFITLGTLESVASWLDPRFSFATAARPIAEKLVPERWAEHRLQRILRRAGPRYLHLVEDLPYLLDGALRRVSEGEFRMAVRLADTERAERELERIASRLAYALVLAALVLGTAFLLGQSHLPPEAQTVADVIALATVVSVAWLLIGSFRRR
jgi:ubiquinone biosynthesis protein